MIRHYDPLTQLEQLRRDMEHVFNRRTLASDDNTQGATADWVPAVDIREEETQFLVAADVPGVDPNAIEVTMDGGVLTLRGERKIDEDERSYKRVERARGSFYRRFSLPDTADVERISAKGRNGVLEIVIPKQQRAQPRRVTVES